MAGTNKRMRKLLNSEVDKYAKDRELLYTTFRESKAVSIIRSCLDGELPKQFIPQLDLKRLPFESDAEHQKRVQEVKNELEIWKAKMKYKAFTFMLDKMIQLFPKVPQEKHVERHNTTLRAIVKNAYDRYIPKGSSQEVLELIEQKLIEHEFGSIDESVEEIAEDRDKDLKDATGTD